jgi:hypothetical protein
MRTKMGNSMLLILEANSLVITNIYLMLCLYRDFRSTLDYCPLSNTEPVTDHQICVCVRKRPLNNKGSVFIIFFFHFINVFAKYDVQDAVYLPHI